MHVIAKDQYGNEVDTQHALEGVDYYCSLCGATVRIRRCVVRTDHFFLFKDKHKSKDCAEIENEKNVVRDPALLNVSKFVRKTILVSSRSDRSNARESTKAPQSSKEVLPPKSLCQLMACGVCQMPADTPIEGGVLSDLLITYRSFSQLLSKNESLGMRVMELQLDSAQGNRIRYVGYWRCQSKWYRMFFEHYVDESLNFEELADELFHKKVDRYGRTIWIKPKYKRFLISGIWSAIGHAQCSKSCGYCANARSVCVGMQIADLVSRNQIYYSDLPQNQA